ncbi:MAG: hypothetical protein H7A33_01795 [Deltaproteobacteria bacterium]|nr:hypothetical protein [Deltaproteobacteria bacterium]
MVDVTGRYQNDLERLVSCGVLPDLFFSQRVWDEDAIAQALSQRTTNGVCSEELVNAIIARLPKEMVSSRDRDALLLTPVRQVGARYQFTEDTDTTYFAGVGRDINAVFQSSRENKKGALLGVGHQLDLYAMHEAAYKFFDLYAATRASLLLNADLKNLDDWQLTLDEAYAKIDLGPLYLLAGRGHLLWGQGQSGGFIFTDNARARDQVLVSHDKAFALPWFFRHLGKWKASFLFGTLGPESFFPWEMFTGMALSLKPSSHFELSLAHVLQFGGQGSRNLSVGQGAQEFFGFIPFVSQTSRLGSNKLTELGFRWMMPEWKQMHLSFDYFMDDANLSSKAGLKKHFTHNSSYKIGLSFLCVTNNCQDALRFEFATTSPIAYTNGEFLEGWTLNQNVIGDSLGPDGVRLQALWERRWDDHWSHAFRIHYTERSANTYLVSGNGLNVSIRTDRAEEKRTGFFIKPSYHWLQWTVSSGFLLEHIKNYGFVAGRQEVGAQFALDLSYDF